MPESKSADLLSLRKPFPPEQIGKLPRGNTKLDYVGHADVTARLLDVDPEWNWAPLALDEHGMPVFDLDKNGNPVGLWITLQVLGVTRLGYGSVPSDQRDAVKVLVGDALRNAAMRFGVALDLWCKGDRADPTAENPSGSAGQVRRPSKEEQSSRPVTTTGAHRIGGSQTAPRSPQELVLIASKATTPEAVREHYKAAGTQGWLKKDIAHPVTTEKMTAEAYLTSLGNELKHDKSPVAAGNGARGEGAV